VRTVSLPKAYGGCFQRHAIPLMEPA
jgi:hypothetical protein